MITRTVATLAALLVAGCATTLDPNYALQLDAYRLTIASQQSVELAKARAEEARYNAMASIAGAADPQSKQMALLALALGGRGGDVKQINVAVPNAPESQEDRALKWAAIFAGPLTSVAQGYFGYRLGVAQSNNTAASTIASYNSMGLIATGGFASNQNIAGAAFATLPLLQPTVTIGGNGVVGAGRYTGDNSGAYSANSGTIRVRSPDSTTTTHNCAGGATDTGGPAGANC